MSNAAKKKPPERPEILDMPNDREEGLAKNFEDAELNGILLELTSPNDDRAALLAETAEAIHELIGTEDISANYEVSGEALDPTQMLGEPSFDPAAAQNFQFRENSDSSPNIAIDEEVMQSVRVDSRWDMAEKLFELVACDRSFDDLVEGVLRAIVQGIGAEAGSVLEVDSVNSEFFFRASVGGGDREQLKSFRVPANRGIVGHVAESRQSVLLQDLNTDEMQLRAISAGTGFETHTCIAAPILLANQLYGVIELFNKSSGGSFNQRDVEELEDVIRMAVKILEVRFLTAELARRMR